MMMLISFCGAMAAIVPEGFDGVVIVSVATLSHNWFDCVINLTPKARRNKNKNGNSVYCTVVRLNFRRDDTSR